MFILLTEPDLLFSHLSQVMLNLNTDGPVGASGKNDS